uniref:Uncharacterized protein n=1 Tax=Leuconostoc citreum TaxID=33964 RepID=A0A098DLL4_LEUCI|nr:Protein of unknown function [Leuconostoc citreum]
MVVTSNKNLIVVISKVEQVLILAGIESFLFCFYLIANSIPQKRLLIHTLCNI